MPATLRLSISLFFVTILLGPVLAAQEPGGGWHDAFRFEGEAEGDYFGSVAFAGDVDGDGIGDYLTGAGFADPGGRERAGSAYVYSGRDGALLWRFDGEQAKDDFGKSLAGAGDIDGDGHADLAIAAQRASHDGLVWAGSVYLYSGASGQLIRRYDGESERMALGRRIANLGDVNGDGVDDLVVGAPHANPGGRFHAGSAFVYSGRDGALLWRFDGAAPHDRTARMVQAAGDPDADGVPDVFVGARHMSPGGVVDAGSAFVYSGRTGSLLHQFHGTQTRQSLGRSVCGVGDLDGDGHDDLAVSAYQTHVGAALEAGTVFLYSGATGAEIYSISGTRTDDWFGWLVDGCADADRDGVPDFLVSAPKKYAGSLREGGVVFLISGATGKSIQAFLGWQPLQRFGCGPGLAGEDEPLPGARPQILIGSPFTTTAAGRVAGTVEVLRFAPYLTADTASLSAARGDRVELAIAYPAEFAGASYGLLASLSGTGPQRFKQVLIPLSADAVFQHLAAGGKIRGLTGASGVLDADGDAHARFDPEPGWLGRYVGRTVHWACVAYDPLRGMRRSSVAVGVDILP